ncbi:hypothetical protein PSMEN_23140 [Ectopseudomonas mendocina]|nr:hypothetical protein PSMEN_23140 [Pseudomonas mendocina]
MLRFILRPCIRTRCYARPVPHRQSEIRSLIQGFITERLATKLEGLAEEDPKRATLLAQYTTVTWLEDAARRAGQIQAVTHTLMAIHPDAKGTNLSCLPNSLPQHALVGSHCLGDDFAGDMVGNAAALAGFVIHCRIGNTWRAVRFAPKPALRCPASMFGVRPVTWVE